MWSCKNLSRLQIHHYLQLASHFLHQPPGATPPFKPFVIGCLFTEPSTRTYCSFQIAAQRLGYQVIALPSSNSMEKGESWSDTIRALSQMVDLLVIRSKQEMLPIFPISIPIINAGNGADEHPTQALGDLFTLIQHYGMYEFTKGKCVTFVGDLKYSRVVHSLLILLSYFDNMRILLVPAKGLDWTEQTHYPCEYVSLEEAVKITDVLYVTRLQSERHGEVDPISVAPIIIDQKSIQHSKPDMVIMHPLPRNQELSDDLDNDPRCLYWKQVQYGVYMRMAILYTCAEKIKY